MGSPSGDGGPFLGLAIVFRSDLLRLGSFFKAFRDTYPLEGGYPWSRLNLASWMQGLFPLWNPYNLLGSPLLANYQSAALSPLLLPLTFLPFESAVVPYLLLRLAAAGWGAFLFCRRLGMGRSAALAGALAFALTGYLIQYANDLNLVINVMIPYLLIAGDRLVKRGGRLDLLLMILASALVLLGGQPAAAFFTLLFGYGYAVFLALVRRGPKFGPLALIGGSMAAAFLFGLPQLLPFFEYLPHAWNFHYAGFGAEYISLKGLVTTFAAGFYGPLDQAGAHIPLVQIAPYLGAVTLAVGPRPRPPVRRGKATYFSRPRFL